MLTRYFTRRTFRATKTVMTAAAAFGLGGAAPAQEVVFSVDWQGPSVGLPSVGFGPAITEGDLLVPVTGLPELGPLPSPAVSISTASLGLAAGCVGHLGGTPCHVEVDALSFGTESILGDDVVLQRGHLWFSTDEFAEGLVGAPAAPNAASEGPAGDLSADVLVQMDDLPPGPLGPFAVTPGHTDAIDGDGASGLSGYARRGLGLLEPNFPVPGAFGGGDNLDALNIEFVLPPGFPATGVFFSLDSAYLDPLTGVANSDSAGSHGFSAADILHTPVAGGVPGVWAAAPSLGLNLTDGEDDLDALAIWENGIPGAQVPHCPYAWTTGQYDMILFSVRRGSPVIGSLDSFFGIPIEEGDVLMPPLDPAAGGLTPFPAIFIAAENLGLSTLRSAGPLDPPIADDLNALDINCEHLADCDGNGVEDVVDIAMGAADDLNRNGVIDACEGPLLVSAFCFCDEASAAPCGNFDRFAGCANSTGGGGQLSAAGSSGVAADNLTLSAIGLPAGAFGIPFMGPSLVPAAAFGDGLRCVGGALRRFPVVAANAAGSADIGPGLVAASGALFPPAGTIAAGSTWSFQHWYRDPGGPCGTGYSVTNAVAVTFTP